MSVISSHWSLAKRMMLLSVSDKCKRKTAFNTLKKAISVTLDVLRAQIHLRRQLMRGQEYGLNKRNTSIFLEQEINFTNDILELDEKEPFAYSRECASIIKIGDKLLDKPIPIRYNRNIVNNEVKIIPPEPMNY
jgi:hypothetical protein